MTGGIATALALPALVGDQPNESHTVLAPPSSLERTVRIHAGVKARRSNTKSTGALRRERRALPPMMAVDAWGTQSP